MVVTLGTTALCLGIGLPLSIGLFPQMVTVKASELEARFQGLKDKKGDEIHEFVFNKGI
jgi:hypothetical protein